MLMSLNCYCVLLIPCGRIMRVLRGDVTELLLCIVNSLWQDHEGAPC